MHKFVLFVVFFYSSVSMGFESAHCPENLSLSRRHYKSIDASKASQSSILKKAIESAKNLKEQNKSVKLVLAERNLKNCVYKGFAENTHDRGTLYTALPQHNKLLVYFSAINGGKKYGFRIDVDIKPISDSKVISKTLPTRDTLSFVGLDCAEPACDHQSEIIGDTIIDFQHYKGVNCISKDIALRELKKTMLRWGESELTQGFQKNGHTYDFTRLEDHDRYASSLHFTGHSYKTVTLYETEVSGHCGDLEGDYLCSLEFEIRCSGN